MIRPWRIAALCLLLAGCATPPSRPAAPPASGPEQLWSQRRQALSALRGFTLEARAAVQRGSEGGSVRLRWHEAGTVTELRFSAPLAQGTYQLRRDSGGVLLVAPDGKRYGAGSLEELMSRHLQWSFPVAGARYWVLGLPDPSAPVGQLRLDDRGRLTDLAQAGWRVSVLAYREQQALELPSRLLLAAGDLQLRLVIDQWTLDPHD